MSEQPDLEHILILAFSPVERDARVLRQAKYLGQKFRVTLAGFGSDPFRHAPLPNVKWFEIDTHGSVLKHYKKVQLVAANLCRISPLFLKLYYNQIPYWRHGWHLAQAARYRVIYCNDADTLPIGIAAARASRSAKIILDLHEYATREMAGGFHWTWERKPVVTRILKSFARHAHGTVTVADSFAPLMKKEFKMRTPLVVHNAPELTSLPSRAPRTDDRIHLIHHGGAARSRQLERMIHAVAKADKRFVLHFMLTGGPDYIEDLKKIASAACPDRVTFEQPVKPGEIVAAISGFDLGIYILPPLSFNDLHAMPNKFFDFIGAGLPVAVAPSVNMASITKENGIGWVAADFEPETFAKLLDTITLDQLEARRAASLKLRETVNARTEMTRLVELVERVAARKPKKAS
ncbi:MAG: hypothetical protein K1X78_04160 [Verrucomicrobiaceae bacterium]|nr:hypothetical protein [Verrucomicrobiaceae bacterium]